MFSSGIWKSCDDFTLFLEGKRVEAMIAGVMRSEGVDKSRAIKILVGSKKLRVAKGGKLVLGNVKPKKKAA